MTEYVHRNVADATEQPKRSQPGMKVWSTDQALMFLEVAARREDPLVSLWTLALFTGMRRGELLGLKLLDVHLDAGTLSVRRTLSRGARSELIEGRPKTTSGIRRIALPPIMVESLRLHRYRQDAYWESIEPAWEETDYVFSNEIGRYLHPNTLSLQFSKAIIAAGVPRIRFHDMRHTSATMLLSEGVPSKVV